MKKIQRKFKLLIKSKPKAAIGGVLSKKVFLKTLHNSQENTYAQVFSYEFCEIFKKIFFVEHIWWLPLQSYVARSCNFDIIRTPSQFFSSILLNFHSQLFMKLFLMTASEYSPIPNCKGGKKILFWTNFITNFILLGSIFTKV